jgi:hypothetical protein
MSPTQWRRYFSAASLSVSEALTYDRTATYASIAVTPQASSKGRGSSPIAESERGRLTKCSRARMRGWSGQVQAFENRLKFGSRWRSWTTRAHA